MKKILLGISFLALQVFALECTEKQYSPFFTDTEEVRYITACYLTATNDKMVFDNKSVKYDKKKQIIQVWVINQMKNNSYSGLYKTLYELDIKNNNWRYLDSISLSCEGSRLGSGKDLTWQSISPQSSIELLLIRLKESLNINE